MVDVALTVAVGVPVLATTVASGAEQDRLLLGLLFGLIATVPLLVRRRWPFAVLAVTLAAATATPVDGQYVFPIMVALYTIGSRRAGEATSGSSAPAIASVWMWRRPAIPSTATGVWGRVGRRVAGPRSWAGCSTRRCGPG